MAPLVGSAMARAYQSVFVRVFWLWLTSRRVKMFFSPLLLAQPVVENEGFSPIGEAE